MKQRYHQIYIAAGNYNPGGGILFKYKSDKLDGDYMYCSLFINVQHLTLLHRDFYLNEIQQYIYDSLLSIE